MRCQLLAFRHSPVNALHITGSRHVRTSDTDRSILQPDFRPIDCYRCLCHTDGQSELRCTETQTVETNNSLRHPQRVIQFLSFHLDTGHIHSHTSLRRTEEKRIGTKREINRRLCYIRFLRFQSRLGLSTGTV